MLEEGLGDVSDGCGGDEGSVCKVKTQEAENFDEEVKSLVSAWRFPKDARLFNLFSPLCPFGQGQTKDSVSKGQG